MLKKELDFKIPEVIRRSYIETYKQCPYKFYQSVIKGNEMPFSIYIILGIDLHDLFDKAEKDFSYTMVEMKQEFEDIFNKYEPILFDGVDKFAMYKRGLDSIDTFYSLIKDMPKPYRSEEKLEFSVGNDLPKVSCTLDRINLVDGELEVCDWKTGNVMVGKAFFIRLTSTNIYIWSKTIL